MPFGRVLFMVQNSSFEKMRWRTGMPADAKRSIAHKPVPEGAFVDIQFLEAQTDTSKFELSFSVQETSLGLAVRAEYNRDLFTEDTIERMLQHFEILFEGILADPNGVFRELPLLSDAESTQLLVEWNNTFSDFPREQVHPPVIRGLH